MKKLEKALERGKAFHDLVYPIFERYFDSEYILVDIGAGNGCCGLFWQNFVHFVDKKNQIHFMMFLV